MADKPPTDPQEQPKPLTLLQLIQSVSAAAFGVQSAKNSQRDFAQQSLKPFILAGVIFTLLFIALVACAVSVVLSFTG